MRRLAHLVLLLGGLVLIALGLDAAVSQPVTSGIVALPLGIAVVVAHLRWLRVIRR